MNNLEVISEVAGIHNGDKKYIFSIIKEIHGYSDGIKFQPYNYDTIALPEYNHRDLLKKVTADINVNDWSEIIKYAHNLDLKVWIDIHDLFSLNIYRNCKKFIHGIKLPVGNLSNLSITENIYEFEKKKIIINFAGFDDKFIKEFLDSYTLDVNDLIIQIGIQSYPTKLEDSNISRIFYLKNKFNCNISYADHIDCNDEESINLSKYAYFAGATNIEKHICLKYDTSRPDYYSALCIEKFKHFYNELKKMQIINGDNVTNSQAISDYRSKLNVYPVLAINHKKKGEVLTFNDITYKRINTNVNLDKFNEKLPAHLLKDYNYNEKLQIEDLKTIKITAVIVVRIKSKRLPGKALKKINGIESIIRCINNVKKINKVNNIVLATSNEIENNILIDIAKRENIDYFIGSENNLLERYIGSGIKTNAEHIVRITGDCPCVSYEIANILINNHIESDCDMTLALPGTYSIGTACEVYKLSSLINLKSKLSIEGQLLTEYLTLFMVFNPISFNVEIVKLPEIFTKYTEDNFITLDTESDFKLLNDIYKYNEINDKPISFNEINNYFKNNRVNINKRIVSLGDNTKIQELINAFNKHGNIDGDNFISLNGDLYEQIKEIYNRKMSFN